MSEKQDVKAKFYNVTVARKTSVVGYRTLAVRLARTYTETRVLNERVAYSHALLAVADFLGVNGCNKAITVWLLELASGLSDLDNAIVRPIFETQKTKAALPSNVWRARMFVALGIRLLTRNKRVSRNDAAAIAVKSTPKRLYVGVRHDQTRKGLALAWYDEFTKERIKNREAASGWRKACESQDGVEAAELAKYSTKKINQIANEYFRLADLTLGI